MSTIRPATRADLPAILAIYNHAVRDTTAIWNWSEVDLDNREAWLAARLAQGYPVLVADRGEGALAYASFGDWRPYDGNRHTVEHSVYVAQTAQGRGLGLALLRQLVAEATALGKHVMLGGIDAANEPSLALHRKAGFVETARMPQVGRKFDRWLDLVFMQKML
jgi:L-amino acid N-acyltransferase